MKTKFKCVALAGVFVFAATTMKSQVLTGGVTAAATTGEVRISNINSDVLVDHINGHHIWGFEGGFYAKIKIKPFYIKPMALIHYMHGEVQVYDNDFRVDNKMYTMNKLEVPLLLGLKIIGPFSIEAGPEYHYLLYSTTNYGDKAIEMKKGELGYRFGAAADLGLINFNLSYKGIAHQTSDSGIATFTTPYELVFGIGIRLGGGETAEKK